jgi:hypothetical protein
VATYYVLGCFGPLDEDRAAIGDVLNTDLPWQTGRRFAEPPPTPVQVALSPIHRGVMVPMFDSGILLMSTPMLDALSAAGVDNLDTYDAVIRDPASGATFTDYKAVNVVGVVACADLGQSVYEAPSGSPIVDVDFDSLVIDERKVRGPLMFRLGECITAIVIHDRVRRQLETSRIPYLDYTDPRDWIG